jgi:Raf kinase inhibitor-like YbhB/YbcL family protein
MNRSITKLLVIACILGIILACGAKKSDRDSNGKDNSMRIFKIKCPAFADNDSMPVKYTCDGDDISPKLEWSGVPDGAKSLALICDDPDAPMGTWVHWVMFNLPPEMTKIDEKYTPSRGLSDNDDGIIDGINDFRCPGYNGPCPPKGPAHRYYFKLYALDIILNLKTGASKTDVEKAMSGHILGQTELIGKYQRLGYTEK